MDDIWQFVFKKLSIRIKMTYIVAHLSTVPLAAHELRFIFDEDCSLGNLALLTWLKTHYSTLFVASESRADAADAFEKFCRENNLACAQILFHVFAFKFNYFQYKRMPLEHVSKNGHREMAEWLLNVFDWSTEPWTLHHAMCAAVEHASTEFVAWILPQHRHNDHDVKVQLWTHAVLRGNVDFFTWFTEDTHRWHASHIDDKKVEEVFVGLCIRGHVDMVKIIHQDLMKRGYIDDRHISTLCEKIFFHASDQQFEVIQYLFSKCPTYFQTKCEQLLTQCVIKGAIRLSQWFVDTFIIMVWKKSTMVHVLEEFDEMRLYSDQWKPTYRWFFDTFCPHLRPTNNFNSICSEGNRELAEWIVSHTRLLSCCSVIMILTCTH